MYAHMHHTMCSINKLTKFVFGATKTSMLMPFNSSAAAAAAAAVVVIEIPTQSSFFSFFWMLPFYLCSEHFSMEMLCIEHAYSFSQNAFNIEIIFISISLPAFLLACFIVSFFFTRCISLSLSISLQLGLLFTKDLELKTKH